VLSASYVARQTDERLVLPYPPASYDRILYMKKKGKEQKLQFTQDLDQFRVKLKADPAATTFYKKHHVYTVTGLPPNSGTPPPHQTLSTALALRPRELLVCNPLVQSRASSSSRPV